MLKSLFRLASRARPMPHLHTQLPPPRPLFLSNQPLPLPLQLPLPSQQMMRKIQNRRTQLLSRTGLSDMTGMQRSEQRSLMTKVTTLRLIAIRGSQQRSVLYSITAHTASLTIPRLSAVRKVCNSERQQSWEVKKFVHASNRGTQHTTCDLKCAATVSRQYKLSCAVVSAPPCI